MALIKKLTRFNVEAAYLALTRINHFDRLCREATFEFSLFKDKATARLPRTDPQGEPLVATAAKLRLTGEAFDRYFGKGVEGRDNIERQAYKAARVERVECWSGRLDLSDAGDDLAD